MKESPRGRSGWASRSRAARASRFGSGFRLGLIVSAVAIGAAPGVVRLYRSWRFRAAVTGESMLPGLRPGDWLLVDPDAFTTRRPREGDLIVVPDPRDENRWLVKRVGSVDPEGRLQLAGDRPDRSTDSRLFGPVDATAVRGRPWARYWPPGRLGRVR